MKYLIDTDWVVHHLRGEKKISKKLEQLAPEGMAISMIALAELYEGIYYSKDPVKDQQLLEEFLAPDLDVLTINQEICKIFGRERGKLRQQKKIIDNFDLLIASTALHYNLTVLTNNRKHFERVEGLIIISLEE